MMAVRHLVFWKLNGTSDEERDEQAHVVKSSLERLRGSIPNVTELTVHRNCAFHGSNWDLALVSEFTDLAALEAYQEHPAHRAAAAEIKLCVSERAAVDFVV